LLEGPRPPAAPESRPYAVVAAHFTRAKGLDVLLEAWAKVKRVRPDVELVVLGDGQERGRLEARAKALGLSGSVRLEGWVDDAIRWIAGARLYVAPSRQDSFGIAVLEAMALGVPVVATAVGGHVELLGSRAREWLVPPEDAGALAEAALRVLALTEDETLRLRRQLQNEAFARFGPEAMARGTCLAYERAIEKWRTGRRAIDAGAARRPSGPDSNQGARQGMSTLTRRRSLTPRPALPHIGRVS